MCDFENDAQPICSWSHDDDADFKWLRVKGDDINSDWYDDDWQLYGPDRDHTLGNNKINKLLKFLCFFFCLGTSEGHFLFLETSLPRKPNDTARIISPVFSGTINEQCQFRFWYHMYGIDIASINIYTRNFIGGPLTKIWEQHNQRGDEWLRAKLILKNTQPFQILIEGVRGPSYEGDIGVDDLSFTSSCKLDTFVTLPPFIYSTTQSPYCNSTHSHCSTNKNECIPKDQFCNFNIECTDQTDELSCPLACTFDDKTLCQWINDKKQSLKWNFGNGHTASSDTGPSIGKKFIFIINFLYFFII